ncbi:MAG: hypothetical protein AB7E85_00840 [Pseudobdellovibrionaceae bacterium]
MDGLLEDIDPQAITQHFADGIDVGIPAGDLAEPNYSVLYAKPNATSLADHENNSYNPAVSVSDMHFRSFVVDGDDDDTNQAGTTESRYDEETEEDKIHKRLQNMVGDAVSFRHASYVSTFVPVIDLSSARIREVSAEEGHDEGCSHTFNGAAKDHVDVEGNEIRVHRVEKNVDPDTRETAQELIEDAKDKGQIVATGDLADNDTLCETDPKSEVCTTSPLKLGL